MCLAHLFRDHVIGVSCLLRFIKSIDGPPQVFLITLMVDNQRTLFEEASSTSLATLRPSFRLSRTRLHLPKTDILSFW